MRNRGPGFHSGNQLTYDGDKPSLQLQIGRVEFNLGQPSGVTATNEISTELESLRAEVARLRALSESWPKDGSGHRMAWLLIETWLSGSVHRPDKVRHEGIALTLNDKELFMSEDFAEGYSRSALPLRVLSEATGRERR